MVNERKDPLESYNPVRVSLEEVREDVQKRYGRDLKALTRYTVDLLAEREIPEFTGWNKKDFRRLIRERRLGPFISDLMPLVEGRLSHVIRNGEDYEIPYCEKRLQTLKHIRTYYIKEFQ